MYNASPINVQIPKAAQVARSSCSAKNAHIPMAHKGIIGTAGTRKGLLRPGWVLRITSTAAATMKKAHSVPMLHS